MGFVKDVALAGLSPAAAIFNKNKRKPAAPSPRPTMISTTPYERPMSLIAPPRGGY